MLLASIQFDQSCCPLTAILLTANEVGTDVRTRSPGDKRISLNIQIEQLLPGAVVWDPLRAGSPGVISAAQESRVLSSVTGFASMQIGE